MSTLDPLRWKALFVIAIAQLMVILDATIVNIALPSIQADLGISDADRQWVVTAYTLTFGGLLLLGGRIADFAGRKRMFIVSLVAFAAASALGGLAANAGLLYAAEKYPQQVFLTTDKFMALHDTIEWSLLSSLARCMYTFCIPEGGGLVGSEMMTFLVI